MVLALIEDDCRRFEGLTLLYQVGRNFLLLKVGDEWEYVLTSENSTDGRWTTVEEYANLKNCLTAASSKEDLEKYLRTELKITTDLPVSRPMIKAWTGNGPRYYLAYYGMYATLMARCFVEKAESLVYLFSERNSKLEAYYRSFYGTPKPPYLPVVPSTSLLEKVSCYIFPKPDSHLLLFSLIKRYSNQTGHWSQCRRLMDACVLQVLINHGFPAVKWAKKRKGSRI